MQKKKGFKYLPTEEHIINTNKGFIEIDSTNYFYKRCVDDLTFRELIAHEIADFLKIPSIFYEPLLIPNKYGKYDLGVLSKDYKKPNIFYIKGKEIIYDYNKGYLKQWYKDDKKNNYEFNNLENIWNALEYRYRFLYNKESILSKIINDIIKNIFLFDIFMQNNDRHYNNWEICENIETNETYLNPIYDNEDIFYKNYNQANLGCSLKNKNSNDWYELLKEFLIISENEYLSIVTNIYNILTVDKLIFLITLTENKHQIKIPLTTKQDIILKFTKHYAKLGDIIKEFKTKEEKRIILKKDKNLA